jgi:hypothetical protein
MDSHSRHGGILGWVKGSPWHKQSGAGNGCVEPLCTCALRRTMASGDGFQRPLVPRSRFPPRLMPSVRLRDNQR